MIWKNRAYDTSPPSTGDTTHDRAIVPIWSQCTRDMAASPPLRIKPRVMELPTIPPIMECVVETGQPRRVANSSHRAAESSADIMMKANCMGSMVMAEKSTIPLRMVLVTSPPAMTAPLTSKMAATTSACLMVRVPAPTLVPKELATSLPPMLNAMNTPNNVARMNRKTWLWLV